MQKSKVYARLPLLIFIVGVVIALFGVLAIYDASVVEAFRDFNDKYHFVKKQLVGLIVGIIACGVVSKMPFSWIKANSRNLYFLSIVLMVAVLIPGIGAKLLGARRWIIVGPVVIQPSEILKISIIIYLSNWLQEARDIKKFIGFIAINLILIMLQPDMGTAMIIVITCFIIYYISGAPLKSISTIMASGIVFVALLVAISPYRLDRIKTFLDPTADPLGTSYHINQVLYGLGSGGFSGVGLGQSRQKYAFLPEATTDSIFVIIAEEFGFLGGTLLICTLIALLLVSLRIASRLTNRFDKLLSSGVSILFITQIFINIGAMTALVPLTGVPLPFISYGGSSLVANFIGLGLLINTARHV